MLSVSMFLLQNRSRNGVQAQIRYNKYATYRVYFLSRYIFSMIFGHLEALILEILEGILPERLVTLGIESLD